MNNHYDQDFSGFDWTNVQLSESDHYSYSLVSEQESTGNEYHLFGTTNDAAAGSDEIRRPTADTVGVAELTPSNARDYNHFLGDITPEPIQQKAIPRVSQAAHVDTSSENADLKGRFVSVADDQASRDRKRKNDRAYRLRLKENKRKKEEELEDLRKQNAALQKKLHKLELKPDGDHQQNASEHYYQKMEFRLDCCDDESRAEAMKIVGGVTGMKRVCMDIEENKLTIHGKDIDTLPLQSELKKICNARLLSLSIEAKIDDEKNEGKIMVERDCMVVARNSAPVARNSVPMSCTTSYSHPFAHIASAYPNSGPPEGCFDLAKAAIFVLIFLIFMLGFACWILYFR